MGGRRGVRIAVPMLVILPLVWLMVGCFYLPISHTGLAGTARDFRDLTGDGRDPNRPIAAGHITRARVERLLGRPACTSRDGLAVAYVLNTRQGLWVYPLCFGAAWDHADVHALLLVYDKQGELYGVSQHRSYSFMPGMVAFAIPTPDRYETAARAEIRRNLEGFEAAQSLQHR